MKREAFKQQEAVQQCTVSAQVSCWVAPPGVGWGHGKSLLSELRKDECCPVAGGVIDGCPGVPRTQHEDIDDNAEEGHHLAPERTDITPPTSEHMLGLADSEVM